MGSRNNKPGRIVKGTALQPSLKSASGVWTLDEAMQAHRANAWPQPNLFQPVANSLRNSLGKTGYISRESPGRSGSQRKFTFSWWLKKNSNATSNQQHLFYSYDGSRLLQIFFERGAGATNPDCICVYGGGTDLRFTPVLRDVSAWYNIVIAVDIDQSTSANTIKCWINGVQITAVGTQGGSPGTPSYPTSATNWPINQAGVYQRIGGNSGGGTMDGQFAEINFIDGAQLQPTLFGQFDTNNTWVPIPYTGSYGTNGFYLPFNNATTSQTLGYDASLTGTATYDADQDPYRGSVALHLTGNGPAGGNNNVFADSSPNNLAVTRSGTVTQGSFSPFPLNANTPYNPATHGASAYFRGSGNNDCLSLASNAITALPGDFTLEAWVYPTSVPNTYLGIAVATVTDGIWFGHLATGFGLRRYGVSDIIQSSTAPIANVWTHVAVTRSGSTNRLFINGVLNTTVTDSTSYAQGALVIGSDGVPGSGIQQWPGYISNLRITKGAAIYTAAFTPTNRPFGTLTNNLISSSEDFTNAEPYNVTQLSNTAIAPDGTPTAWKITENTTAGVEHYWEQSNLTTTNATYTQSIYIKPVSVSRGSFAFSPITVGMSPVVNNCAFNVSSTGVITTGSNQAGFTTTATSVGNGWYRITATYTTSGAITSHRLRIYTTPASGAYTGDGTSSFYIWGSQLETGGTATNYTPTPANFSTAPALLLNFANAAVVDTAGANNITTVGTATITSASKYGSGALTFNGTTDRLEISGPSAQSSGSAGLYGLTPNLIPGTKDFTVEYWLYTRTGNDTYHRIVSSSNGAFSGATFCMRHQPGSFLFGPASVGASSYSTDFTLNTWTHVAYSRQGATGRGFINGRQVVTCGDTTNYTEAIQYVGSFYSGGASEYFNGALDDVRITMGVSRYNTDFAPPARALPETGGKSFVTTNVNAGVVRSFTTTGTTSWTAPTDVSQVEVLVVAAGGTGAADSATNVGNGGGGGGGVIYNSQYPVTPGQSYTVTVGAGQIGLFANSKRSGGNSQFGNLIAIGGGGGGYYSNNTGAAGGSGGGGGAASAVGGDGTAGQGFSGGSAAANNGGGGGGAGGPASGTNNRDGGPGIYFGISGTIQAYGGGGGGSASTGAQGAGGVGGGGAATGGAGTNGTANTGGGGGAQINGGAKSGDGGSGIVLIRYTTTAVGNTSDATTDNLVDSPTLYGHDMGIGGEVVGNYATWNPLIGANYNNSSVIASSIVVLSNGNLNASNPALSGSAPKMQCHSTIGMTTGKWYAEFTGLNGRGAGISLGDYLPAAGSGSGVSNSLILQPTSGVVNPATGASATVAGTAVAISTTDVVGVAFDTDNRVCYYYRNGVLTQTASNITTTLGTPYFSSGVWYFSSQPESSGSASSIVANFGQRAWAYTPPAGFNALTTKNFPRLTNAAAIAPNQFFDISTWTQGATDVTLVNSGSFQPDFVWIKSRNTAQNHYLMDSVRGATSLLRSNGTGAESTGSTWITFNSNGFTPSATNTVTNTYTYVGWQWKAGGTPVSNTSGTITSSVSANTTSGFSIVSYTGTGSAATIGHGLGVTPSMITVKQRNGVNNWPTWHTSLTGGNGYYVYWDSVNGTGTSSTVFNGTNPTSSVFSVGTNSLTNGSTSTYVAYCWAEVPGFSKFGTYTGNGNADGPFVYTGFTPRFVMVKKTDSSDQDWYIWDTARSSSGGNNALDLKLYPNQTLAENGGAGGGENTTTNNIDAVSNGFKLRTGNAASNASGANFIYAAFAAKPFGNVNGTAR